VYKLHILKIIYHRHPWILGQLLGGVLDYRYSCQRWVLASVACDLNCRLTCPCCLSLCHLVRSSALPRWSRNSVNTHSSNCYRQDAAKRQTAGIVFTHRPKIRFFAPQGRLLPPIQVKLCSVDGHLGPLGCAKFHVNRCRRVGMRRPKYQKIPLFGKESPRRGDSLDRFPTFLGAFIHLTILR